MEGAAIRIVFLGLTETGEAKCFWVVPSKEGAPDGETRFEVQDAVELEAPKVRLQRRDRASGED